MATPKRLADEPAFSEPKRRLLFPLPNKMGLAANPVCDLGEEDSTDLSQPLTEPQMLYDDNAMDVSSLSFSFDCTPHEKYFPRESCYQDFPIIKNGLKLIRIGVDLNYFTPFISLMAKTNNKVLYLTPSEFHTLVSEELSSAVVSHYEKKITKPLSFGSVSVSVLKHATSNSICVEKDDVKVYLALSSWKFIQRIKQWAKLYLEQTEGYGEKAASSIGVLLNHAKHFCLPRSKDFEKIPEEEMFFLLSAALHAPGIIFPEQLKQEILIYHLEFVKGQLVEMFKKWSPFLKNP